VWGWRAAALCAGLAAGAILGAKAGGHASTTKAEAPKVASELDSGRCTLARRVNAGKVTFSIVCDEKE
jgi:hypothetical protein